MARGITFESEIDASGNGLLLIRKNRGRLTLQEIGDLLRYEQGGKYQGQYAIFIEH